MQVITGSASLPVAYAMCMDMPLAELMEKLDASSKQVGLQPSDLDTLALQFGWAPVTIAVDPSLSIDDGSGREYGSLTKLMVLAWPRNVVFTTVWGHYVAHDTKTRYFHDPLTGIRPLSELPPIKAVTIFFDVRSHYED